MQIYGDFERFPSHSAMFWGGNMMTPQKKGGLTQRGN